MHPGGPASVFIDIIAAECRHFVWTAVHQDHDDAEFHSDGNRPFKKAHNLIGKSGRHDIVIPGRHAAQMIPDATADKKGFKPFPSQAPDNFASAGKLVVILIIHSSKHPPFLYAPLSPIAYLPSPIAYS